MYRAFRTGEGDVIRHLYSMGYSVTFEQHPMDEYDFRVSNIAVDLRDGVRLARAFEIASGSPPLSMCKVRAFDSTQLVALSLLGAFPTCCADFLRNPSIFPRVDVRNLPYCCLRLASDAPVSRHVPAAEAAQRGVRDLRL